jgi:hypothetical protein
MVKVKPAAHFLRLIASWIDVKQIVRSLVGYRAMLCQSQKPSTLGAASLLKGVSARCMEWIPSLPARSPIVRAGFWVE